MDIWASSLEKIMRIAKMFDLLVQVCRIVTNKADILICLESLCGSRDIVCVCVLERASCQMRQIAGCACAGNAGNVFPANVG